MMMVIDLRQGCGAEGLAGPEGVTVAPPDRTRPERSAPALGPPGVALTVTILQVCNINSLPLLAKVC